MTIPTKLMTTAETKREYHFSHSGLYRAIAAGQIEAVKSGRTTLIVRESVERWLASLPRLNVNIAA